MNSKKSGVGKNALIIGGSMAGKLAARALSESFEHVTLVERDEQAEKYTPRKGVPQGSQGHGLLKSGELILEEFFPGIVAELIQDGSVHSDFAEELAWYHHGQWKMKYKSGISIIQQSRPLLEWHVGKRLEQIPNVEVLYGGDVERFLTTEDRSAVTGVELILHGQERVQVEADLVVDASGVGSQTPRWLDQMGYESPRETEIKVGLTYSSRLYRRPSQNRNWKSLLVYPNPPHQTRGGLIFPIENDQWMVTLFGYGEDHPPTNEEQFLEYAASLDQPDLYEAIRTAEPISEVQNFRFPALRLRHYHKLKHFPKGLVVMGDAFCRFDPVFGQGMSVAAKEAIVLHEMLQQITLGRLPDDFSRQAHQAIAKVLSVPWLIVRTEDYRFPQTVGKKPFGISFLKWYVKKVILACSYDRNVYDRFAHVLQLIEHPIALFHPSVFLSFRFAKSTKPKRT